MSISFAVFTAGYLVVGFDVNCSFLRRLWFAIPAMTHKLKMVWAVTITFDVIVKICAFKRSFFYTHFTFSVLCSSHDLSPLMMFISPNQSIDFTVKTSGAVVEVDRTKAKFNCSVFLFYVHNIDRICVRVR